MAKIKPDCIQLYFKGAWRKHPVYETVMLVPFGDTMEVVHPLDITPSRYGTETVEAYVAGYRIVAEGTNFDSRKYYKREAKILEIDPLPPFVVLARLKTIRRERMGKEGWDRYWLDLVELPSCETRDPEFDTEIVERIVEKEGRYKLYTARVKYERRYIVYGGKRYFLDEREVEWVKLAEKLVRAPLILKDVIEREEYFVKKPGAVIEGVKFNTRGWVSVIRCFYLEAYDMFNIAPHVFESLGFRRVKPGLWRYYTLEPGKFLEVGEKAIEMFRKAAEERGLEPVIIGETAPYMISRIPLDRVSREKVCEPLRELGWGKG